MPGFPIHHQLLELAQTQVHPVGDAIQPSHPLSSPSPPTFNLSQRQGLFQGVSSSHQVAKVLELQLQHPPPLTIQKNLNWGPFWANPQKNYEQRCFTCMAGQTSDNPTSALLVPWIMTHPPPITSFSSGWHIYLILPFCFWTSRVGLCTCKIKLVFLLFFCLLSIWLLDQLKKLWRYKKHLSPQYYLTVGDC